MAASKKIPAKSVPRATVKPTGKPLPTQALPAAPPQAIAPLPELAPQEQSPNATWLDGELPQAKLNRSGTASLTDGELLSLMLAPAQPQLAPQEMLTLVRNLLLRYGSLDRVARLPQPTLVASGLTEAAAQVLIASFELGRRRLQAEARHLPLTNAAAVAAYVKPLLADQVQESCVVLYLNRANQLMAERILAVGGVSGVLIDPKLVFREAVSLPASAVVLCHNHPSGSLQPSAADIDITVKLKAAGKLLDIELLDHLVISYRGFYSFAENGRL